MNKIIKDIRNIEIIVIENYLRTKGLDKVIGFEIQLLIQYHEESAYTDLLQYLINYLVDSKPLIKENQTIAYHSWLLKFTFMNKHFVNIYEVKRDGDGFIEGAEYAIKVVKDQYKECLKNNTVPLFPTFSQMIAVSKGVIEGEEIDAVRYPSPDHMTGWWLTTVLYDGDIDSLETIHYYHVAFKRPEVIKFLALPFGFRFFSGGDGETWFDKDVIS